MHSKAEEEETEDSDSNPLHLRSLGRTLPKKPIHTAAIHHRVRPEYVPLAGLHIAQKLIVRILR